MEGCRKEFGLGYRTLLATVVADIGGSRPDYITRCAVSHVAAVVVPAKAGGHLAYYFEGGACDSIERSEEIAAEKAVLFLFRKKKLRILDFNFRKMEENLTCAAYYKAQTEKLLGYIQSGEVEQEQEYSRTISIDFCALLRDVLDNYGVSVTDVDCLPLPSSQYVCLFGIRCDPAQVEWLMGPVGQSVHLAKQNLARKALRYLQPRLNFEVIDLSYHRMKAAQITCALNREEYLSAIEGLADVARLAPMSAVSPVPCYTTPQNPENRIEAPSSPPPVPKKRRLVQEGVSEALPAGETVECLFEIPDDLSSIFTVTGRM